MVIYIQKKKRCKQCGKKTENYEDITPKTVLCQDCYVSALLLHAETNLNNQPGTAQSSKSWLQEGLISIPKSDKDSLYDLFNEEYNKSYVEEVKAEISDYHSLSRKARVQWLLNTLPQPFKSLPAKELKRLLDDSATHLYKKTQKK